MENPYCSCKLITRVRTKGGPCGVIAAAQAALFAGAAHPPQHGLLSSKMARITSDYGTMRSPRTKWP